MSGKARLASAAVVAVASLGALLPNPVGIDPARMARLGRVDERFQSYNIEMVEVTGGRFWAPYGAQPAAPEKPAPTGAIPAIGAEAFRMRPPLDLAGAKLRLLAAALGPAYLRVSGTWANSTYFHDADGPAPAAPPAGFGGVLTHAQWRGVVEFAKAVNAKIVTSFAISPGVRDESGAWTPGQAQKLLAYTASIGGAVAAAEFFNEPNIAAMGGAPKNYDAAAYGRDFRVFLPFVRKAALGLLVLGPGSIGEGGGLIGDRGTLKSEEMLSASGPGLDAVSYHFYGSVSKRCAALSQPTAEAAMTPEWLARPARDAGFYAALRDRFEPGKPLWLTETAETACGGNLRASTFVDVFRYLEQLGRLARRGVQVVAHNTLAASDYGLIDEVTLEPRPNYWAALLWRRLMGATVLDAGPSPAPGVDLFSHCLAGRPGGVAVLAVNANLTATSALTIPVPAEGYTLTSPKGLLERTVNLNGKPLALGRNGDLLSLVATRVAAGRVTLPPASVTFLAFANAGNAGCRPAT